MTTDWNIQILENSEDEPEFRVVRAAEGLRIVYITCSSWEEAGMMREEVLKEG